MRKDKNPEGDLNPLQNAITLERNIVFKTLEEKFVA